jgi:hypothetical protein
VGCNYSTQIGDGTNKKIWLVVSTPLKNIRQLGSLLPIYVPKHQPDNVKTENNGRTW